MAQGTSMAKPHETAPMDALESPTPSSSSSSYTKPQPIPSHSHSHSHSHSPSPSPLPSSISRLWRPAAQRNLRNQWSKLASHRQQWASSSSRGKSHANSLVNAHLSQRYMPSLELGILNDMPDIRKKACRKLFKQQELYQVKLISSYKDMVAAVTQMVNACRSMRCYQTGTNNSALVQFSNSSGGQNDTGDGGGVSVFVFLSISSHEKLAEELVRMFITELNVKRLLVLELLSISCEVPQDIGLHCGDQLYQGEIDQLSMLNLFSEETFELVPQKLMDWKSDRPALCKNQPNPEVLKVYLTTWLAEVNINAHRIDEIFSLIGEEMHVSLT